MSSPNPGGSHRELMRNALADWITAANIEGVAHVFASHRPSYDPDEFPQLLEYEALVRVVLPTETESRAAHTGPDDRGGKDIHYAAELHITHRGFNPDDWEGSENDYDRIVDALKDCLRGPGRDLGRPLVVFQIGEWPRDDGITASHDEPEDGGATVDRHGVISCTISQYLQPST